VSDNPAQLRDQNLLFDADDTLWENNIYFERAISAFISYLDHRVHTDEEVREHLNEPITDERHARIVSFADSIAEQEIEVLPRVHETLHELKQRHRLIMVTKGNLHEQTDKLERSGLAHLFSSVEVLAEKHEAAYRDLTTHHGCAPNITWMIGNSPKSDINPALAAGLNAVFIPHDFTWVLEHEVIDRPPAGQRLIELAAFAELKQHF
jgi:putative hydrolase of the HAD superfamily